MLFVFGGGGTSDIVLLSYLKYYNEVRTHLSLEKDAAPSRAPSSGAGSILCRPVLGGLYHQYVSDLDLRTGTASDAHSAWPRPNDASLKIENGQ